MNISAPFIKRPVMTTILTAAALIFGSMAYPLLPVSDLPNVDYPVISVSAMLAGASPETMASSVAIPLEKQFSTISGVESMSSSSSQGMLTINLQFNLDRNIDSAALDVQSAISRAQKQLPTDMTTPPSFTKVNPADQPIIYMAMTSPTLPMSEIDKLAQSILVPKISMTSGVAQVMVYGSQKYAVRIRIDPKKLAAWGLGIDEVQTAIDSANVDIPGGSIDGRNRSYTIQPRGQLLRAKDYTRVIVAVRNGRPIRVEDIGSSVDSVENDKVAAWFCTRNSINRAIVLAVQKQPGVNTVKVADAVKALIPELEASIPPSVKLQLIFDRSQSIRSSANEVQMTMAITLGLVVLIIFMFLKNARATLIPSLSLPLSLLGTFAAMYMLGYSLDNLSLMALTLSLGFVVDDAIVALENIFRHYEMGKTAFQAAMDGSKEISFTVISMTLSLVAVFIPVFFMGGIVGRLFREFAVTIGIAVLISGLVAITLIPMLASRFIKHSATTEAKKKNDDDEEGSQRDGWLWRHIAHFYKVTLSWSVHHTWFIAIVSVVTVLSMIWLYHNIPKGFVPNEDQNRILIRTEAEQGVGFESLKERQRALAKIVQDEVPEIQCFMCRAGGTGTDINTGVLFLSLIPKSERKRGTEQIMNELRGKLSVVPGIRTYIQTPVPIQVGARAGKSLYQYTLIGADTDALYKFASSAEKQIALIPEILDVSSDLQISTPQIDVNINRDQAAKLGVSPSQLENALYSSYGARQISTIYATDDQYEVLMECSPERRDSPNTMSLLYVRSSNGQLVPLDSLVCKKWVAGPLSVNHTGQLPSVTISFNLKDGVALGEAVTLINDKLSSQFPPGVTASFQGTAEAFQKSTKGMGWLLLLTVLIIYMVLGILYESFIHPLTILTALPFAGVGALLSLYLLGFDLSIYAFVGLIMLVGIVKKNGIMMVDFAIEARKDGMSPESAIVKAATLRFRPIMMTTLTALMSGIPLAVASGLGSEARQPLGVSVVGGIVFSQFLTLYATPVFYVWMEKLQTRLKSKKDESQKIPAN